MKSKVRNFIEDNLLVFDDEIVFKDEDNIFEMGFVNSLFAMRILNYLESEFSIDVGIEEMDIKNFSSLNNIVGFIKAKKGKEV